MVEVSNSLTWTVTKQVQRTMWEADGSQTEGFDVYVEATNGYKGTVFVPLNVYGDPQAVKELIVAHLKQVATVQSLTGTITH